MVSRREGRYLRRQEYRNKKKDAINKAFGDFWNICSMETLYKATRKSGNGVRFKGSVQRFEYNILFETRKLSKDLEADEDIREGFVTFMLCEYGKWRKIDAVKFRERVAQKSLCINALIPLMLRGVIKENSASQNNKGITYAHKILREQLKDYYNQHGNIGYILNIDFKHYFESISHEILKGDIRKKLIDKNLIKLCYKLIDAYGDRGLGLGAEICQILAICFSNFIDHYIKQDLQVKWYGRYMDDSYIIAESKEKLREYLQKLKPLYEKFELNIHPRKTIIKDIHHGFVFLKTRYKLTETGKILKRPCTSTISKQRVKLKKQIKSVKNHKSSLNDVASSYVSWRGCMGERDSKRSIYEMDKLLLKLLKEII